MHEFPRYSFIQYFDANEIGAVKVKQSNIILSDNDKIFSTNSDFCITLFRDFHNFLFRLERSIRLSAEDILLAGDLNAKHSDWGFQVNDPRGEALSDLIHAPGLLVYNIGNNPTFKSGSIIEVTFSSPGVVDRVSDWCLLDVESPSDHFYIQYNIHTDEALFSNIAPLKSKWKFNYKKLDEALSLEQLCVAPNIMGVEDDA
ncbi:hypothetical protein AGLY_010413 [Aphis glycines]|uniref:Endonuclease/exonuclease/phosphatase domain-containing protein n=1 Tax=Aphis glycines TaxID=307491 RepID=A0A6G0TFM4_APHGL|nr:hypothetical protein AGLY_010413 [Aphis glycines]